MSRTNWLSFVLPDDVRDALYEVGKHISENSGTVLGQGITFRNMEHGDIHMTALFIGDGLHLLKHNDLSRFHSLVEYTIFPPGKNNLIVARFEADKEVYDYAEHLLESSEKTGLKGLREKHNLEPHVTLGKINATKAQVAVLSKNGGPPIPPLDQAAQVFTTDGCYLCGKTPPQAYLDWTFSVR